MTDIVGECAVQRLVAHYFWLCLDPAVTEDELADLREAVELAKGLRRP